MANKNQFLTTAEFASKTGMTTSSVTKMIRAGKIKAEKKSGKWMISPDQLSALDLKDPGKPRKKATAKNKVPAEAKTTKGKMYTVAEFAAMTYLTEFGVKEWLKNGRLSGRRIAGEEWRIDAANLELTAIKKLIRQN